MAEDLVRLIYLSTTRDDLSDAELAAILEVARRNNPEHGVTGALAYHDHTFLQVLEGPQAAVEGLLAKISRDDRHRGILILHRSTVDRRVFGEWSMGWIPASDPTGSAFNPGLLRLRDTSSAVVNAMLDAFRQTVRLSL